MNHFRYHVGVVLPAAGVSAQYIMVLAGESANFFQATADADNIAVHMECQVCRPLQLGCTVVAGESLVGGLCCVCLVDLKLYG